MSITSHIISLVIALAPKLIPPCVTCCCFYLWHNMHGLSPVQLVPMVEADVSGLVSLAHAPTPFTLGGYCGLDAL